MFFKFINDINRNIKFTMEMETNNSLNFLDVLVLKRNNHLGFKIYQKPTTTDIVINAKSNHPYTQKMAAFNALAYRLLNVPMNTEDYKDESNVIKHIALRNGYKIEIVDKIIRKQLRKINGDNNKAKNKTQYVSALYTNLLPNVIKN